MGLYLSPPDNALVLCVDEKSQCQALERTQPMLPMGLGYVEGVTHDYVRHGTTTLFAALNVLNGAVLAECKPRHRHQEFVSFLRTIDQSVPAELDIHCIVDNYATHSHPKVRAWLAARPRWHMHFIPTYSSWLNQVERFFGLITDKAIRRGSFSSVKDLVNKIDHFVASYNTTASPSPGLPRLIPYSRSCIDFARVSAGQHTSARGIIHGEESKIESASVTANSQLTFHPDHSVGPDQASGAAHKRRNGGVLPLENRRQVIARANRDDSEKAQRFRGRVS